MFGEPTKSCLGFAGRALLTSICVQMLSRQKKRQNTRNFTGIFIAKDFFVPIRNVATFANIVCGAKKTCYKSPEIAAAF
jgi:hypothetical protein